MRSYGIESNSSHSPKRKIKFRRPTLARRQSTRLHKCPDAPPTTSQSQPDLDAKDEEADEYDFHANIVSDIVQLQELEEYWGVCMPVPVGDAADVFLSEGSDSMQGASLSALIYMLTDPQPRTPISDDDPLDTFLLCFRSFCEPVELAKALIARYEEQPVGLNDSQREAWPVYQSSVRAHVLRLINAWIDQYWIHERDRIAGLHMKEFLSRTDGGFAPEERTEIIRKLNERREEAISLVPFGDSMDQRQSSRAACRQKPILYKARLQARVEKFMRSVSQRTPTDEELQSAEILNDLLSSTDGSFHILDLNSLGLCRELARQLAIFMSEGYMRVIPEDLWYRFGIGHDCDADTARSTQQTYESALSSWVMGSILDQVEAETRAAVMTFFIALALVCFPNSALLSLMLLDSDRTSFITTARRVVFMTA
jgi:RasGEF N-terminal motif